MVIDNLKNSSLYTCLHPGIKKAFDYLYTTDLKALPVGKHDIEGEDLFAMVQEYDTKPIAGCKMEAHIKHIDVQFMVYGAEQVGHALMNGQEIIKQEYSDEKDYMLFADEPSFTTVMAAGTFMIFFPADIHMPCIQIDEPAPVKKVVVKVKI